VDVDDSLKYFNKACDDMHPVACKLLFGIFVNGKGNVVKNSPRAFEYASRGCDYGDMIGCYNAARMARIGDGIPKDAKLAELYHDRGEVYRKEIEVATRSTANSTIMGELHK
jgi:TPR repeat protein